jgi:xanthine dehydrogenase molybdopterin-binding subunit B
LRDAVHSDEDYGKVPNLLAPATPEAVLKAVALQSREKQR